MENETNLTPKKRGRPFKKTESQTKEMPSANNVAEPVRGSHDLPQATDMEAKEVELGVDMEIVSATMDRYTYIDKCIKPKYPLKHIAYVYREDAEVHGKGWELLRVEPTRNEVRVVKSMDEATKTDKCVLVWRRKEIQDAVRAQWQKKQDEFNNFESKDDRAQVEHANMAAKTLASRYGRGSDLSVTPL